MPSGRSPQPFDQIYRVTVGKLRMHTNGTRSGINKTVWLLQIPFFSNGDSD